MQLFLVSSLAYSWISWWVCIVLPCGFLWFLDTVFDGRELVVSGVMLAGELVIEWLVERFGADCVDFDARSDAR